MLLVVVLRDILISGIRMVAANKNFVIAADIYGKVKSLFLDVSNMVLMLYVGLRAVSNADFVGIVRYIGLAIMIVGVVLSIISCVNYTMKASKVIVGEASLKNNEDEENDRSNSSEKTEDDKESQK